MQPLRFPAETRECLCDQPPWHISNSISPPYSTAFNCFFSLACLPLALNSLHVLASLADTSINDHHQQPWMLSRPLLIFLRETSFVWETELTQDSAPKATGLFSWRSSRSSAGQPNDLRWWKCASRAVQSGSHWPHVATEHLHKMWLGQPRKQVSNFTQF